MVAVRKKKTSGVGDVLPGVLRDNGWERQLDLHSVFPRWRELLGDEVAAHSRPLKVERGVLWLEVENSTWLQQIQYMKLELLDILNDSLRLTTFNDLKMVLPRGSWKSPESLDNPITFTRPDPDKVAAFRRQAECISDEACREALVQFWYLAHACRKADKDK